MGQLSHRVDVPFPLFDADNHLYEPEEALTKYLPREYEKIVQYVQVNGRTKIALRGQISNYIPNPTFSVVAKPGAWEEYFKYGNPDGKSKRELFGEPMRSIPAFFEPGPRLELMDELGLDRTLMFPTLASLVEERLRDDPSGASAEFEERNREFHRALTAACPSPWLHRLNALLYHVPALDQVPRAGIVHRLDRDTSGLLVVARDEPTHRALRSAMSKREMRIALRLSISTASIHG